MIAGTEQDRYLWRSIESREWVVSTERLVSKPETDSGRCTLGLGVLRPSYADLDSLSKLVSSKLGFLSKHGFYFSV